MKSSLKLARVGMNMEEATIVKWHKQAGDRFAPGDILYAFETEKVSQDVEATAPGTLLEILVAEGDNAEVGQIVCVVDVELQG
jgi:pyruvate/2-oxoglutarate dehydrogenase complex dihydrolipoamide acyltransferase (E2) component